MFACLQRRDSNGRMEMVWQAEAHDLDVVPFEQLVVLAAPDGDLVAACEGAGAVFVDIHHAY
jgi:hypothetical protein